MSILAINSFSRYLKLIAKVNLFSIKGYLNDIGWTKSFLLTTPCDKHGSPLPWVTYPFIDFIKDKLNKNMTIFEYGSGNSTLFYASRVQSVTAVEHDLMWFDKISKNLPSNIKIIYQNLEYDSSYSQASLQQEKFNIIIIDGRDRVNCIKNSINSITHDGVIILDDSERKGYQAGCDFLSSHNFRRLDFWGISPGLFYKKCTTIFYKNNNILTI